MLIQAIDKRKTLYEKYKEIQQPIDQKVIQIYSAFNYLFFQYYNKVQIVWFGDQTFEIICFPQSIVFIDQYNLFYIIDKQNQLISFYKINKLFNYLQPTKRYVYEIPKSYQRSYTFQCYEILYEDIKTKSNIINYEFKNECQSKEEIIVKKDNYNFPNYQEFLNLGEYQNTIKYIIQNVYLKEFCPVIEQYLEENELLYYQPTNLENYAILNSNDTLQVLFCNNQSSLEKDVRNYQVIQFQNGILLIKKKLQNTKVIYYSIGLNQQHQIQINSQIQEILQFKQYVILQTENQEDYLFLDILNARKCEISNKLKNMLNILNKDQIQSKMIRFYFDQFPLFQIYQINKQLVIEKADLIYTYKMNDLSVIYTGESMKLSHNEILLYKYCVIAIHNKYNIIKQFILDDSLKLFENYQIEDYDLIRPIVFQNSQEFLVIALIQQDQNYLFIFQIYQPLKLIKILKIGKLKFHLINNLLYYYNKDQEIQIFNVKYITISYMNLAENQKQIVLNEKIPILFKHQIEENPQDQLYLEIKVNNYCRKLNSQQNEQIIYVEEKEMIRIENIDMFYGPIDQLSLINNPKLQLVGPFLQQQEIEECLIQQEVCYTNMVFEQTVNDEQQTLFYSLRYYNKYKILPFYSIKNLKENEIITKDVFIFRNNLVLYFSEIKKLVFADVLYFNRTLLNQQYDKLELQGFKKDDFKQAQFYQSNNLILIKTNQSEKLLKVTQNQIAEIEINFSLANILFIEKSDNQYIEMKIINKLDECYFLFNIFQLKNTDLLIKNSIKIEQDKIESILFTQIDIEIYQLQEYFKNQLLESYLIENEIELKVLQIGLSFSVISKITINLNKQNNIYDTIYDIQKIIRHPKSYEMLNFEYYDNNILILSNSNNKQSFLYDLRQIKQFYDYIQKIDDNLLKLYPLNTTHYLFYFKEINQFIIGEIGFEIQRLEDLDDVETCIIKASNQVSQSQFTLIIKRVMFLSKEAKIMTTSAILLGSFYLLRRNKLKQQEIQNQISINSQIIQINND
ncbi:unnamed protein product [Paramecium primaurelia]|uniref:Uncharacterized protein n=1 Tax=Paramecium primaurelia TaxID=5886 RepID=A0A8S1PQL6_PARPR|nr:unnamed protein product [Paramecium primaurelia]